MNLTLPKSTLPSIEATDYATLLPCSPRFQTIVDCVPTVGYLPLMLGSRQASALNEWTAQCPKVTGTHPMFYNRRSSVVPSHVLHYEKFGCFIPCFVIGEAWLQPKKKKKTSSWVGTFQKCLGKGVGGGGGGGWEPGLTTV
jgi:hypothetical protein